MVTAAEPTPVRVIPPAAPMSLLRWLRTAVRNPLEVWPEEIYRERTFTTRLLGRKALFLMDPQLIEKVLLKEADKFGKTELIKRVLGQAVGNGIVVSEGPRWKLQRRIAAPIFRPDRLKSYAPGMIDAADRSVERFAQTPPGTKVSLFHEMLHGNFDALSETVLAGGGDFDVGQFSAAADIYLNSTGWVIALGAVGLPENFPYPGRRRRLAARDHVRGVTNRLVAERRNGPPRADLIQALLDARDEETGEAMNDTEIVDNLLSFIAAGFETTALTLTWTIYLLSLYPEIEKRVLDEIADIGGPDNLKPEHLTEMPYMSQVIHESLRLYPPIPSLIRHAKEDTEIGGIAFKKKRLVFIPTYAIHRHGLLWSDPDRFDPDRFTPDKMKARSRYAYLPFGGGPRTCIGMGFALLEIAAFLAKLLPRFRFEPVGGVPMPTAKPSLRPSNGMQVIVHWRNGG